MKPIISVKEARKLLPKDRSESLTDEEVAKLVDDIDFLAKMALDSYKKHKAMNKTAFIVPGYPDSPGSKTYEGVVNALKNEVFRIVPIEIPWQDSIISDNVALFEKLYRKQKTDYNLIFGHSLGAMIAFIAAVKVKPDYLILCSISPYFEEDQSSRELDEDDKKLGQARLIDARQYNFEKLANRITSKTVVLVGDSEDVAYEVPQMIPIARKASELIQDSKLIVVSGTGHAVSHNDYPMAIKRVIEDIRYGKQED